MLAFLNFIGPWVCGAFIFGIPVALAWWLSDGFADVEISSSGTRVSVASNPHTQRAGLAVVSNSTNVPVAYID